MEASTSRLDAVSVRTMLTGSLRTVLLTMSVHQAAETLTEDGIGLLVVENSDGQLAGVVSERDLVSALANGADVDAERLVDIMTDDVVTIDADESVFTAASMMDAADVRHLVVVDGARQPIGVVSVRDVVHHLSLPAKEPG